MTGHPDYISSDTGKITKVQHSCMPGLVALCCKIPLSLCINVCFMYIYVHSDSTLSSYTDYGDASVSRPWPPALWMDERGFGVTPRCYTNTAKKCQRNFVTGGNSPCWLDCEVCLCTCSQGLTAHPHQEAILAITTVYSWEVCRETVGNRMCCTPNWQKAEGVWGIAGFGCWGIEALLVALWKKCFCEPKSSQAAGTARLPRVLQTEMLLVYNVCIYVCIQEGTLFNCIPQWLCRHSVS